MPIVLAIANLFGISVFRLIMYAGIFFAVLAGAIAIRQHYVDLGYHKAIADVKRQDDRAVDAANKVEQRVAQCSGYWDVITQACILEEKK